MRRYAAFWSVMGASKCITSRPVPVGLTWWNAGLPNSAAKPYGEAALPVYLTSFKQSWTSSPNGIQNLHPLSGRQKQRTSWLRSKGAVSGWKKSPQDAQNRKNACRKPHEHMYSYLRDVTLEGITRLSEPFLLSVQDP